MHIRDDVLDALAGVAGQLFREIAQHLGCHQLAHLAEIAAAPGLLNRRHESSGRRSDRRRRPSCRGRGSARRRAQRRRRASAASGRRLRLSQGGCRTASGSRKKITPPMIKSVSRKPSPVPKPPKWLNSIEPRKPPASPVRNGWRWKKLPRVSGRRGAAEGACRRRVGRGHAAGDRRGVVVLIGA